MSVEQLTEIAQVAGTVDRQAGVVRNVKIIGLESRNGRTYLPETLRKAAPKYEGVAVNTDHSKPGEQRRVAERFGRLRNVRTGDAGLFADLHYLTSHPLANVVAEAAERMADAFGLSHDVFGKVTCRNGKAIVEEIETVRSVDLVADPATTGGLFESLDTGDQTARIQEMTPAQRAQSWREPGNTLRESTRTLPEMTPAERAASWR